MRKAFTIIELMMVLAIIGILLGIVTTAASNSIKQARARKADACCALVQQGIATYYAQKDRWPGSVGERIKSGSIGTRSNQEGDNNQNDPDRYVLNASEINDMIREVILEAKKGNPLMDISGLYVSRSTGESGDRRPGMDFLDAVRGTRKDKKKMKLAEMNFGYPETDHGYFRRFKAVYSVPTDEILISKQ